MTQTVRLPMTRWTLHGDQTPHCRNVTVGGRRTSVRMEPIIWHSLNEIASANGMSVNSLCNRIDSVRGAVGLTAAIRLFVLSYYKLWSHQAQNGCTEPPPAEAALMIFDESDVITHPSAPVAALA